MPASTVNRNYPYSIPGDPADVAQALEDLAKAVNDDVENLESTVGLRPMARVRGTTPLTIVNANTVLTLPFELIDFNYNGAIAPLEGDGTIIRPQLPGVWLCLATMNFPQPGASTVDLISLIVNLNFIIGEAATHRHPTMAQGTMKLDATGFGFAVDGINDQAFIQAEIGRSSGTAPQTIRDRSLTLFRMTQS
jgi:hypothetical protein